VPNLVTLREKIVAIFDEFFENRQAINISIGSRLDTIPIVRSALLLLSLSTSPSSEEIKSIILSPYINGFHLERSSRMILHNYLDAHPNPDLPWAEGEPAAMIKSMLNRVMNLILANQNKKLLPSCWKNLFIEILKIFGWPSDEKLSALEFRAATAFYATLEKLSSNDAVVESMFHEQAMQLLKTITNSNTIQLRDEEDAAINILGTLEGAGIEFDHLWIMGLDENSWPGSATPNPFIPMELQKRLDLPHSSPAREREFCKNLLARYGKGAKNIIFSYVKQDGERETLPSKLISNNPLLTVEQLNLPMVIPLAQKIYRSKNSESIDDHLAPAIVLAGGAEGGLPYCVYAIWDTVGDGTRLEC
jgi:superfamily I DNA/RNA helicase